MGLAQARAWSTAPGPLQNYDFLGGSGQHLRSAEQAYRLRRPVEGLPDGVVLDLGYVEGTDDLHPVRRAGGASVVALEGVAQERLDARGV